MTRGDRAWVTVAAATWLVAIVLHVSRVFAAAPPPQAGIRAPAGVAALVVDLASGTVEQQARPELLDTPMLPGSVAKAFTLVAAIERGVVTADSRWVCRRAVTVDGHRYTCSHPDLKRPLSAVEALAYSCNDFFVSLAPRLPRSAVDDVRRAAGLPALGGAPLAASLVGLDGPRVTPRDLLMALARLAGAGGGAPVPMAASTRALLRDGLAGAARYGTATAFADAHLDVLAKTGTAPMPGGGIVGITVALAPAAAPRRGVVTVVPGAAGLDASGVAADLLKSVAAAPSSPPAPAAAGQAVPPAVPAETDLRSASGTTRIRLGVTREDGSVRVEEIPLEDYVARVLAAEGQPRAGAAAQQALAIAVRTFALANRARHRREGYELCDTTHCQVVRPSTAMTRQAALATAGTVLQYEGAVANVFYSALCGGRTALASEVWPGATDYPYEPARDDDACRDEPGWTSEISADDIVRALRAAGMRGSRFRELQIVERTRSGRVGRLRVPGFAPETISGYEFRMAVGRTAGWQLLKSTAFDLDRSGRGYRFRGRGFGHGVGLCVIGAGHRAERGEDVAAILGFYYPGLVLATLPAATTTTTAAATTSTTPPTARQAATPAPAPAATPAVAAAGPPAARPATGQAADVRIALPASEEAERAGLVAFVRQVRDDIATQTGAVAPATVTITVHPTVESFNRSTGQPWWVAAATTGTSIEVLPITVLRERGLLERTLRHELVHVLLDGRLASRPMWVREGVALMYSSPDKNTSDIPRVVCPTDAELLRPVSPGAQREAYGRAEQCVRREVGRGTRWDQIR